MEKRSDFLIPFASLPVGEHYFDYEIRDSFFAAYEHPLLNKAQINVHVVFHKTGHSMNLNFHITGSIRLQCGRCLEDFDMPVDAKETLLIRLIPGEVEESLDENVVNISDREHAIDLSQHLYDYLSLQVPLNPVHADDKNGKPECDPKVLKLLDKIALKEKSKENDPRWDALRNIKLN